MGLTNFDVGNIGNMKNSSINEGNEFAPNSNATRSVDNGTPDAKVSVPGGDKESPSSKPYDQHSVTIPGGDGEKPHASAVAGVNVSVPGKITLTDSEYNAALDMLQKSFKEGGEMFMANCEAIERLKEAKIISDSDAYEQDFVENAIDEAMLAALENGPLFEAVDRSDKKEVKKIVTEIRKDIKRACEDEGASFYKPALVARLLTSIVPPVGVMAGSPTGWHQVFSTRLWQVLGICHIESGNVTALQNALTEKFKEQLGDYKILLVRTQPSLHDVFKVKFNWKNNKGTYFMLVDKKLDSEIKKVISSIKPEEGNNDVKTESFKEGKEMEELYKVYLSDFIESDCSGVPLDYDEFVEAVLEDGDDEDYMGESQVLFTYEEVLSLMESAKSDAKKVIKRDQEIHGSNRGENSNTKKEQKAAVKSKMAEIEDAYDEYKADCKSRGVKAEKKSDFIRKYMNGNLLPGSVERTGVGEWTGGREKVKMKDYKQMAADMMKGSSLEGGKSQKAAVKLSVAQLKDNYKKHVAECEANNRVPFTMKQYMAMVMNNMESSMGN